MATNCLIFCFAYFYIPAVDLVFFMMVVAVTFLLRGTFVIQIILLNVVTCILTFNLYSIFRLTCAGLT